MSFAEISVGELSVEEMSVREKSVGDMSIGELSENREKVLTLQKPLRILKTLKISPNSGHQIQVKNLSHQISWNLDELLKSYKTKYTREAVSQGWLGLKSLIL